MTGPLENGDNSVNSTEKALREALLACLVEAYRLGGDAPCIEIGRAALALPETPDPLDRLEAWRNARNSYQRVYGMRCGGRLLPSQPPWYRVELNHGVDSNFGDGDTFAAAVDAALAEYERQTKETQK